MVNQTVLEWDSLSLHCRNISNRTSKLFDWGDSDVEMVQPLGKVYVGISVNLRKATWRVTV